MRTTNKSIGISARLSLGFLAVLSLVILIAVYSITQIDGLGRTFESYGDKSGDAIAASDLQKDLLLLQASIARLAALNSKSNQTSVETAYEQFRKSFEAQPGAQNVAALAAAVREIEGVASGPASLAAIQDEVDAARGEISQSVGLMSNTVAAMMHDIEKIGDVGAIVTIQDRVLRARMLIRSYQFTGSPDEIGDALAALRDAQRKFDQFARMDASIANNPLVKEGQQNLETMFTTLAKVRTAVTRREQATARALEISATIAGEISAVRDEALRTMTATGTETKATVGSAFHNALGAAAVAVVIGLALAFFIGRSITVPIRKMTMAMRRLSEGELATVVPGTGRRDELGEMALATQVFKDAAIERQRIEAEATARLLADEEARRKIEAEAAQQAIAGERAFVISKFGAGIRSLAKGDLSLRLNEEMPGEYERLRHDFNEAIGQLGETLRAVAGSASSIDGGSREISQGSDDLSKRTEQQAASLEETAAALDQITVNVATSSKRAEEARSVAQSANASAAQSAKVVAHAVDAMGKIEQSSAQISNIIGVIDEIAFQTNLLALNAGVEAARAGDAGKGFAVVAQEVRELAQRSAKAAKEIKELIRNSNAEVQSGVQLVSQTGDVLRTIEGYIVTVNQHMDAIATSSREQSTGLAEVNSAVNRMDQVTQQNAAMVEETSAASATLAAEAYRLQDLIAKFTFDTDHQAAALRRTASAMASNRNAGPSTNRPARLANVAAGRGGRTDAAVNGSWEEF